MNRWVDGCANGQTQIHNTGRTKKRLAVLLTLLSPFIIGIAVVRIPPQPIKECTHQGWEVVIRCPKLTLKCISSLARALVQKIVGPKP